MLSFFTRRVITPFEMLVQLQAYILDIAIIICIIHQLYLGVSAIIFEKESYIPVLYEYKHTEDDNLTKRVKWLEEIKKNDFFRTKNGDAKIGKENKIIADITDAPIYNGNLKLVGILKHTDESQSIAILSINGEQNIYFIHDEIENSHSVIVSILADKIIISEKELYYTLAIK